MIEIMMELKPDGKRALYEQIYEYIRNEIADGKISQGRKITVYSFIGGKSLGEPQYGRTCVRTARVRGICGDAAVQRLLCLRYYGYL